jgi:hypothetical protein
MWMKMKNLDEKAHEEVYSFFNKTKNSFILNIEVLVLDHHPTPDRIKKAEFRITNAKIGKYPKRKPISVVELPEGKYRVLDGNTTTTVLKSLGYNFVLAEIVENKED